MAVDDHAMPAVHDVGFCRALQRLAGGRWAWWLPCPFGRSTERPLCAKCAPLAVGLSSEVMLPCQGGGVVRADRAGRERRHRHGRVHRGRPPPIGGGPSVPGDVRGLSGYLVDAVLDGFSPNRCRASQWGLSPVQRKTQPVGEGKVFWLPGIQLGYKRVALAPRNR